MCIVTKNHDNSTINILIQQACLLPPRCQPVQEYPCLATLRRRLKTPSKKPEKAKRDFNKAITFAIKISKKDAAILANRIGAELGKRGHYQEALPFIEKVKELDPECPEAHHNLGLVFYYLKQYKKAEVEYREALRLKPDFLETYHDLCNLLRKLKRPEDAVKEYREALRPGKIAPDNPDVHNNLGVLFLELKQYEDAESEWRELVRRELNNPAARNNLGLVFYEQKRYEEAEIEYRKALELSPDFPEAHINLAVLLGVTNRHGEAENEFTESLGLFRENRPERLEEAVEYLEKELETHYDSYQLWRAKGVFLKALGREAEAKKSMERAEFYEDIRYFEAHKEELLRQYEGKFVAILHNEVVDSDEDFEALGERVIKRFGVRAMLVTEVTREPEIIYIPTPFLVQ